MIIRDRLLPERNRNRKMVSTCFCFTGNRLRAEFVVGFDFPGQLAPCVLYLSSVSERPLEVTDERLSLATARL